MWNIETFTLVNFQRGKSYCLSSRIDPLLNKTTIEGAKAKLLQKQSFSFEENWTRKGGMTRDMGCTWERYDASYSNLAAEEEVAVDAKLYISGNFLPNLNFRNFFIVFINLYILPNFILAETFCQIYILVLFIVFINLYILLNFISAETFCQI